MQRVGRVESVTILSADDDGPASATALLGELRLLVPMKGIIDVDAERARLTKQLERIAADVAKAQAKLGNEKFVNNAPAAVVAQERERLVEFERDKSQLAEQLERLAAMSD